jgi:hypothetical protein
MPTFCLFMELEESQFHENYLSSIHGAKTHNEYCHVSILEGFGHCPLVRGSLFGCKVKNGLTLVGVFLERTTLTC